MTLQTVWLGTAAYRPAWELQMLLAEARLRGEIGDALLLLEHPPVYTMGRKGDPGHIPGGVEKLRSLGAEYVAVDRGGSVTFHGPGQLVAYPIIKVGDHFPQPQSSLGDVVALVRALEEALMQTVAAFGVTGQRRPPHSGVWVGQEKIAAIGVKVSHDISSHGVALNVNTDLAWFSHIIPCGIAGAGVASLAEQAGKEFRLEEVACAFAGQLARVLGTEAAEPSPGLRDLVAARFPGPRLSATSV